MGIIEEIDKLDLADDVKDRLKREHQQEISPLVETNNSLRAQTRQSAVEQEVAALSDMFGGEAPGLVKYVRRVLLSDDEQPGAVLLTDADMALSGDVATGATSREEISVAGALRKFIELLPKKDGKIALSDQALLADAGTPPKDENEGDKPEITAEERSARVERLAGRPVTRTRKRYAGGISGGVA